MNRYNQVPHLTQDTNVKVTNSQLDTTNESQEVSPFPAGDHKAHIKTEKLKPTYLNWFIGKEALAIRRIFSLVDMITKAKFSNCPIDFKIRLFW